MIFADTHIIVWLATDDSRLPTAARSALVDLGFSVSVATAFEYADLHRRGRLPASAALTEVLSDFGAPVEALPADSWLLLNELPPVHQDPIDRMLVAHALSSGAVLASADRNIRRYPVPLLW